MKRENIESLIELLLPETKDLQKPIASFDSIMEWVDLKERRLNVPIEIDDDLVATIGYLIKFYNNEDNKNNIPVEERKPIKLFIHCYGGALYATMAVCDLIKMSKTPVWTINEGVAYSAGGLLLIAGHRRFAYPSSSYLLHSGSTGAKGSTTQVFDNIDFQRSYEKHIKEFVCNNTSFTEDEYDRNYRVELYLDSKGMIEHGVVDEIVTEIM